jgi:choline dehydrogenase-like flavoprotein
VTVKTGYATQHALLTQGVKATDQATLEVMWIDGIIYLALLHPFSRGSVKLASTDPFEAPLANPAFLSNPVDLQILVEGVKYTRKVFQTDALSAVSPAEVLPGTSIASDAEIENWIRSNAGTVWHPLGSSKVGMLADGAVVDDNFKVYGVQNLRVVDASVVPMSIGAHNQATVYALAEKAADAIKC